MPYLALAQRPRVVSVGPQLHQPPPQEALFPQELLLVAGVPFVSFFQALE